MAAFLLYCYMYAKRGRADGVIPADQVQRLGLA
jgi:hypothetical protein